MNIYKIMENRRSIRNFSRKKIPRKKIVQIINAGQLSPSGANKKPFVYIIVEDTIIKEKIKLNCESVDKEFYNKSSKDFKKFMKERKISLKKDFLVDAPYLIIVAGETDKPYWLESTWISITYVILAAEYEGFASLTYTPSRFDFIKDLLKLPKGLEPVSIIPIGYAKK